LPKQYSVAARKRRISPGAISRRLIYIGQLALERLDSAMLDRAIEKSSRRRESKQYAEDLTEVKAQTVRKARLKGRRSKFMSERRPLFAYVA